MHNSEIGEHISSRFDFELSNIRNKTVAMGELVEQQLAVAIEAFAIGNIKLAERVIQQEKLVNDYEVAIDADCVQVHALRQPTAFDLRWLIAIVKTIAELERIGDLAERTAHTAIHLQQFDKKYVPHPEIRHLAELAGQMLHAAMQAFEHLDADAVLSIFALRDDLDREQLGLLRQLTVRMTEDPRGIKHLISVLTVVRAIESIGQHAANICNHVVYLMYGTDIRHVGREELERTLHGRRNPDEQS